MGKIAVCANKGKGKGKDCSHSTHLYLRIQWDQHLLKWKVGEKLNKWAKWNHTAFIAMILDFNLSLALGLGKIKI